MILVLKSENSEIHIPVMSSADILMVSKLPVWVLSSRDLGARCPTFSVPAPCVPCAEQLSLVSESDVTCAAANIYMWCVMSVPGLSWGLVCSALCDKYENEQKNSSIMIQWCDPGTLTWRQLTDSKTDLWLQKWTCTKQNIFLQQVCLSPNTGA